MQNQDLIIYLNKIGSEAYQPLSTLVLKIKSCSTKSQNSSVVTLAQPKSESMAYPVSIGQA